MDLVRQLDEPSWRDFVGRHPQGAIFHTPEMFQVFAQTKGYRPDLWAMIDDSGHPLVLFVPVMISQMEGPLSRFTTRAIVHGSVLCEPGPEGQQALDILLRAYKQENKRNALFTELRNMADLGDLHSILSQNGFVYEEHLNYLIDLGRPASQVLQTIGSRTRKKIRKGLRDELVKITIVTDRSELNHWYSILQKTYHDANVPLADRTLFEAIFDRLYPRHMALFFLARVHDVPAACSLELPYKDVLYGWYGGCDRQYSSYYPNEVLMWHVLEWGVNNGYRVYDFGGAGKPDEEYGVRDFKAKFGGELVHLGRYVWVHSPMQFKLSKLAYSLYRQTLQVHSGSFLSKRTGHLVSQEQTLS